MEHQDEPSAQDPRASEGEDDVVLVISDESFDLQETRVAGNDGAVECHAWPVLFQWLLEFAQEE